MPKAAPKICGQPGCPNNAIDSYCEIHNKDKQYNKQRGTAAQRGYDYRWQKERKLYLLKNPLCVRCQAKGKVIPATVVDHDIPHKGDMISFYDKSNWQSLCKPCHDTKTAKEDGRWETR